MLGGVGRKTQNRLNELKIYLGPEIHTKMEQQWAF